jgi:hypothetical protein
MMECHLLIGCILLLLALIFCRVMVVKTYLGKMRGQRIKRAWVGWKDAFWSWVGAFTGTADDAYLAERHAQLHRATADVQARFG